MDVWNLAQKRHLAAPMIGAAHHTHTSVAFINIVQCDPCTDLTRLRHEYPPQRRILMPTIDPHRLLAVYTGFGRARHATLSQTCQLPNLLYNNWIVNKSMVGSTRLPNINDLPDRTLFLTAEIGDTYRLWNLRFLIIINNTRANSERNSSTCSSLRTRFPRRKPFSRNVSTCALVEHIYCLL